MKYQSIQLEPYLEKEKRWPQEGRPILAQYDNDSIIVYQAYRPEIGLFAVENQYFGGEIRLSPGLFLVPNPHIDDRQPLKSLFVSHRRRRWFT